MKKIDIRYNVNGTFVTSQTYNAVKSLQPDFGQFEFSRVDYNYSVILQLNTVDLPECLTRLVNLLVSLDCSLTYLEKYGV